MQIPKMNKNKPLEIKPGQMKGLYQGIDDNLLNWAYSPDCQNIDVSEGILSTRKGSAIYKYYSTLSLPAAPYPITKFLIWGNKAEGNPDRDIPIIATSSSGTVRWYAYLATDSTLGWKLIVDNGSLTDDIASNSGEDILYPISSETNFIVAVSTVTKPQKLLYSGVEAEEPPFNLTETITATDLGLNAPSTNKITLHKERIWAANGNTVYYAKGYDPTDWSTVGEAGSLLVYTNDGDEITAITNWLDDVLIFKQNSIFKVNGDIPSEYNIVQVYSTKGTIGQVAITTDGNYCFFLSSQGIYQYTGTEAKSILNDEVKDIWSSGGIFKLLLNNEKLYAIGTTYSFAYDIKNKTIEVLNLGTIVDAILYEGDRLIYTDGTYLYELDNTSLKFNTTAISAYWITPESDFGLPNVSKTLTDINFIAWGTTSAGAAGGQIKITVYYNENGTQKTKEKTITMQTTKKRHNIAMTVSGRLFKFKFENVSGSAMNISGLQFLFDPDED